MKVTMFKAGDNSLHATFDEYATHEELLRIKAAVAATELHTGAIDDERGSVPDDQLSDFIHTNAEALRKILAGSAVVKRGRRSKKDTEAAA